ncbi:MAG: hypothetical protein A4E49_00314 [Methanosaeta sp. PtaU1.Bin112]|nr:MAG: hypothetical protein A4E49_00314 [Methanosaeta sp. PtaU1.Bin112]
MEYLVSLDLYRLARPALRLPIVDAIVVRVGDYAFQERIGEIAVAAPGVVRSSFKGDCRQMLEYVRDGPLLFCFETVIVNRVPEAQRIKESLPDVSPALYRFVGHAQAPAGFGYLGFVRLLLFRRPRDDIIAVEGNLAYGQEEALHRRDRKGRHDGRSSNVTINCNEARRRQVNLGFAGSAGSIPYFSVYCRHGKGIPELDI